MIRFRAFGIRFRLHVLAILTAGLALALGDGRELLMTLMAMAAHESAHIAAARLCGLRIETMELMPFGGVARLERLYSVPSGKLISTALAGPFANGICAILTAALAWLGILPYLAADQMFRIHLILMLFNFMPALPLDGGRVFFVLLRGKLGVRRAMNCCMALSLILATGLTGLFAYGWFRYEKLNLTLLLAAVFLVSSSLREREAAAREAASRTVTRLCAPEMPPYRAAIVVLDADARLEEGIASLKTGENALFAMAREGKVTELLTESGMAKRILNGT